MTSNNANSMCMLYYADVGGGAETRIEQVQVNNHALGQLTKRLQMMTQQRVLAFFGQRKPVLASVSEVIGQKITDSCLSKDKENCIYVAIKDMWVAIFAIIDQKFFEQGDFNKESIVVTLFRYLQDFSANVLLCMDDDMIANFAASKKNPFTYVAHAPRYYMLEAQKHVELKVSEVVSHCGQLERDLDFKLQQLVLDENGSRFFLHQKQEALQDAELKARSKSCESLLQQLKRHYNLSTTEVVSHVREYKLELTSDHLRALVNAHMQYGKEMNNHQKTLASELLKDVYSEILKDCSGDSTLTTFFAHMWRWIPGTCHILTYSEPIKAAAENSAHNMIEGLLTSVPHKIDCSKMHKTVADEIRHFFTSQSQQVKEKIIDGKLRRVFAQEKFSKLLNAPRIGSFVQALENTVRSIFNKSNQSMKNSTLRLNVCAINTQQSADGTCSGLIIAPFAQQITVQPQQLENYFPVGRPTKLPNVEEVALQVKVKAIFPLRGGQSFLLLFDNGNQRQTLVAVSSVGAHSVVTRLFLKENYKILPYQKPGSQSLHFVLILRDNDQYCFDMFAVNDAIKHEPKLGGYIEGSIRGTIVSAATFPVREKVLVLTDLGSLYEIELNENTSTKVLAKELKILRNTNTTSAGAKAPAATSWSDYSEVLSIQNDKFFIMRSTSKVDIFNWNFELQLSLQVQAGSAVKVFSDDKNVYLVAFSHGKITSHVFPDLGADVTLRQQRNEDSVNKEKSNPIIDVIYASHLKYGLNATFIGAPAQSQYFVALNKPNALFQGKLESYLKTFQVPIKVEVKTLTRIGQECQVQQANRHLPAIMSSRTPVHICTVEANNLLPLVDGNRMRAAAERATSIAEAAECMSFAHLERVVNEFCADRSVRVVSIIGRQSSGKSYLLNQLFGTRFSVAATRCTDGIWMSYARLVANNDSRASDEVEQSFLVLDCEGLFSVNRNEQEEVKLLLVLAAISDVTILNQDLNFNRHINRLFEDLNNAIGKVSGSNYFHGVLMVAVRDVGSTEGEAMAHEFERNIKSINGRSQQFLMRLFNSSMILHCLNHFGSPLFTVEIGTVREGFLMNKFKCTHGNSPAASVDGLAVLGSLKVVLQQVYNDDEQSADEHLKQIEQNNIYNSVIAAWGEIDKVGSKAAVPFKVSLTTGTPVSADADADEDVKQTFEVAQNCVQFEHATGENDCSFECIKTALEERFFSADADRRAKQGYNQRWTAFNAFLVEFVRRRAQLLEEYAQEQVQKLGRYMKEEDRRNVMIGLKEKIHCFTLNNGLCLEQCALCYLKCLNRKGHKESLEPQKQYIQTQLAALNTKYQVSHRPTHNALQRETDETKAKLDALQRELSEVEKGTRVAEERYQEAVRFDELCQKLAQVDKDVANKQHALSIACSRIDEIGRPPDSLPVFVAASVSKLQLVKKDCTSLRNGVQQLRDTANVQSTSTFPADVQTTPLGGAVDDEEDDCTVTLVPEAASSLIALHDSVDKLLVAISDDLAGESSENELAMSRLSELGASLPALTQHAKQMVAQTNQALQTLVEQQTSADDLNLTRESESLQAQITANDAACNALSREYTGFTENLQQQKQRKAHIEAELDRIQNELKAKQAELTQGHARLANFETSYNSWARVEQQYNELTEQMARLTTTFSQLHSTALSEEESRNVAQLLLQYVTHYNNEKTLAPESASAVSQENLSEEESEEHASLASKSLWRSPEVYVQFAKELTRAKKLEQVRLECLNKIDEQTKRQLSIEKSLRATDDLECQSTFEEKLNNVQNLKIQLQSRLNTIEADINQLAKSAFHEQCQRQLQLYDKLVDNYSVHLHNNELLQYVRKVATLEQANLELKQKLQPNTLSEAAQNTAVSGGNKWPTDLEEVRREMRQCESELHSTSEVIHNLLWNKAFYEQVQHTRKQLFELGKSKASLESLLSEWRNLSEVHATCSSDTEALGRLSETFNCNLQEATTSIDKIIWHRESLQQKLSQTVEQVIFAKSKLQERQNNAALLKQKLNRTAAEALIYFQHGKQLDEALTQLENRVALRQQFEKHARRIEQLHIEISSLQKEKTTLQTENLKLETADLGQLTALQTEVIQLKKKKDSISEQVKEAKLFSADLREYMALITNRTKLEKDISCVCIFTNHDCEQHCSICPDKVQLKCKHKAGHDDPDLLRRGLAGPKEHCCDKPKHDCPGKCHLCQQPCVYPLKHANPAEHLCASSHQCESRCQHCTNKCRGNLAEKHTTHLCTEDKCPKRCILCGNPCSGQHDHDATAPLVDVDKCFGNELPASLKDVAVKDPKYGRLKLKLHLCEKEHQCSQMCVKKSVCEIHYVSETRVWSRLGSSHEYEYIKPERSSKRCALRVPPGSAWHKEVHDCGKMHTCDDACPECGSFCKEAAGHGGLHKTALHRNMEHCYYVTKTKGERVTVQDSSGGKQARVYQAGDALTPEICTQHCKRKGRAHYHLRPCPSGPNCGERKYSMGVQHCNESFYPFIGRKYDKYLCSAFWNSVNWQAPSNDPAIELCNFVCPNAQHNKETDKHKFCTGGAWHTQSMLATDHTFECGHDFTKPVFKGLDMCFCLDTTGSMEPYIKQSAESIKRIMVMVKPQLAAYGKDTSCLRFAVVGYRDHCDAQVVEHVNFCSDFDAVKFLDSMKATGGGDGPEAVLDGLDCASKLSWRADCVKLLVHICDAPPHGRQFTSMQDNHPDGCPCRLKEENVLQSLRRKSINYYVIPLTSAVNQMIEIFSALMPLKKQILDDNVQLKDLIQTIACSAIEDSELTATASF